MLPWFCAALSILHPLFFSPLTSVSLSLSLYSAIFLSPSFVFLSLSPLSRSFSLHVYNSLSPFLFVAPICSLSLSLTLYFFLFISLPLSIWRLLSLSAIYFSLFPFTLRCHYYTYFLFFSLFLLISVTLTILLPSWRFCKSSRLPAIVRSISHNVFSKISKQSSIQAQV